MNNSARTALIIGGAVLLVLVILSFFGGGYGWSGNGWGMMGPGMMGGYGGWWMIIPMVLVPILIVWAIVAAARGDGWFGAQHHHEHTDSAMELLKKRYARGEISKEEFEEKKGTLA